MKLFTLCVLVESLSAVSLQTKAETKEEFPMLIIGLRRPNLAQANPIGNMMKAV